MDNISGSIESLFLIGIISTITEDCMRIAWELIQYFVYPDPILKTPEVDSALNKKSVDEHLALWQDSLIKANEEASIKLFSSQFLLSYARFSVFIVRRMRFFLHLSARFSPSIANNCLKLLESLL